MIISQHIPKTAGTSLMTSLRNAFGDRVLDHNSMPDLIYNSSFAELATAYDVVHGHIDLERAPHVAHAASFIFTFLRDPVERVISSYFYHTALDAPEHPLVRQIRDQKLTLEEFADLPSQQNLQYRMIRPVGREKIDFYGFVETYEASVRGLASKLAVDLGEVITKNTNPDKSVGRRYEITDALRAYIAERNPKDRHLYEWALKRSLGSKCYADKAFEK